MHTSDTTTVLPSNADVDNIGRYPAGTVVVAAVVASAIAAWSGILLMLLFGGAR